MTTPQDTMRDALGEARKALTECAEVLALGHQVGPYAYAGESMGRYMEEACTEARAALSKIDAALADRPTEGGGEARVTSAMVEAYLKAQQAYCDKADHYTNFGMLQTPQEACRRGLAAALAVADIPTEALSAAPEGERYCLACDKHGHQTHECWSTHGTNTPEDRELMRLAHAAGAASSSPASPQAAATEPVAWRWRMNGAWVYGGDYLYDPKYTETQPLYTHPAPALATPTQAAAPAVPLTDEQIGDILRACPGCLTREWFTDYARAIERAHGIKGSDT